MPQVGIDLVELSEVGDALERFGDAYRRRAFTRAELIGRPKGHAAEAAYLGGLVAGKEAVLKLLGPWAASCSWHQVEVLPAGRGWTVRLSGSAKMAAQARSVTDITLSISVSGPQALALALGS